MPRACGSAVSPAHVAGQGPAGPSLGRVRGGLLLLGDSPDRGLQARLWVGGFYGRTEREQAEGGVTTPPGAIIYRYILPPPS